MVHVVSQHHSDFSKEYEYDFVQVCISNSQKPNTYAAVEGTLVVISGVVMKHNSEIGVPQSTIISYHSSSIISRTVRKANSTTTICCLGRTIFLTNREPHESEKAASSNALKLLSIILLCGATTISRTVWSNFARA